MEEGLPALIFVFILGSVAGFIECLCVLLYLKAVKVVDQIEDSNKNIEKADQGIDHVLKEFDSLIGQFKTALENAETKVD